MVNNINSKRRFYYYKIIELSKCTEYELVLIVHDFQAREFISVKIVSEDADLFLMQDDARKHRVIGISKEFPSTHFCLDGHPSVDVGNACLDFMANRVGGVEKLSDLYDCYINANGKVQNEIYLDSWLITDANNINNDGKAGNESH